jgi:hypothetical protein
MGGPPDAVDARVVQNRFQIHPGGETMSAGTPLAGRHAQVASVRTAVHEAGDGPLMILRHGQGSSGRSGCGWPLHVIEDARDDPAAEQPQALVAALRIAVTDRSGSHTREDTR